MKNSSYIDAQIALIPDCGDDALYRLASYLEIFDNLTPDTRFSPEQRQTIENFIIGWQAPEGDESEEMDFPECQYVAGGLDLETAQQLGNTYRAGKSIPGIGHEATDRISSRLNQMQSESRRTALRK